MALTAEQIAEARSEGYSDAEILDHYAKTSGIDLTAARKEGYSNAEILSHVSGADVSPQDQDVEQEYVAQPSGKLSNPALSGALGAGAGVAYSAKTVPVKVAKALGNAIMSRMPMPDGAAPSPATYHTPSGIPVEPTPGGLHPGAVGGAKFNVEQVKANQLLQNMEPGYEQRGTSHLMTPIGMEEPAAALGGAPKVAPLAAQKAAIKAAIPAVGGALRNVATSNPVAGAIAGYNLQDALNRKREGDITGATIGGIGAGSQLLPKMKGKAGLIKPVAGAGAALVNKLRGEPESVMNKAEGGAIEPPHIEHMRKGGAVQHFKGGKQVAAEEVVKGVKALFTPRETKIIRASEALTPHEGKYLNVTQSDRMRSTGGDLGGPGFSRFQTIDPAYEGAAWGVGKKPTASAIVNYNKRFPEGQAIWSPMIGSETQHHSNQHVFDTLANEFNRNVRLGKLSPELRQRANERLQKYGEYAGRFDPNFDIANPEMLAEAAKTFDRRGALAEVMSGKGVGGQKGSIIDYPAIMQEMTDPMTVGAPTHSIGTRLFNLTGEVEHRPDLHSAFPYILKGEDQAVAFNPIPKELALRDWMQNFRDFKGRSPGYYDMTRTIPSQQITEDYLRSLEAAGHAEGGRAKVNKLKGGLGMLPMAQRTDMRQIGQTIDEYAAQDPRGKAAMLYNSPAVQNALLAGSMVNPELAIGVMGRDALNAMGEGNYGEAALTGGLSALPFLGGITRGVRAMPHMAGGGDVVKSLIKKTLGAADNVGSRAIEGSPHSYPPIAEGPWMRDYQAAVRPEPKIAYMGKYVPQTQENYMIQKSMEQQAIRDAMDQRKAQWIARSKQLGMSDQQIADEIAHSFGDMPWMP